MRKLVFAATMLASGLALASGPSTDMPATAPAAAPVATTAAFNPGIYADLQLGYADLGYDKLTSEFKDAGYKLTKAGFAARLALGYAFTENLAAELGYLYLPKAKFTTPATKDAEGKTVPGHILSYNSGIVDLFVKGTLPVADGFNVFARLGAGYVHNYNNKLDEIKVDHTDGKFVPALGLGAGYNFNDNVSVDANWNYYFKSGDQIKAINFFGIGAAYKFNI